MSLPQGNQVFLLKVMFYVLFLLYVILSMLFEESGILVRFLLKKFGSFRVYSCIAVKISIFLVKTLVSLKALVSRASHDRDRVSLASTCY